MKTIMRSLSFAGLLALLLPGAGFGAASDSATAHLRVLVTDEPVFPAKYIDSPIRWGEVRVVIGVDADGKLFDHLVTAYTQEEFADSVLRVLPKWKFVPMQVNGYPSSCVSELSVHFERSGVQIVTLDVGKAAELRMLDILGGNTFQYEISKLSQLDGVPIPKHLVAPVYPTQWADKGIKGDVKVSFYIDRSGHVRLPSVVSDATPQLAYAALNAVEKWVFEPPTRKGRPVVVKASQLFEFIPGKGSS